MKNYTLLDHHNARSLSTLIDSIDNNSAGARDYLLQSKGIICIFGVISWITNDAQGNTIIKVVKVNVETGEWDKNDRGIYVLISNESCKELSMEISDLYIGDEITATLRPDFSYYMNTSELCYSCYDIREDSGYGEENGKIIPYEEYVKRENKKAEEKEREQNKKEKLPKTLANLSIIISLIGYAMGGNFLLMRFCGGVAIILGIVSYFQHGSNRAIIGPVLGFASFFVK